ncbi:MAG TPA: VOC family protein [Acidimicrobiales bacterium]|jgi:catechol 2,3-dioxygenase-like lactoylglutathione lyase family enzyme|nr:VOC family protein [Acidimicrobiales bacterium]
MTTSLYALTFDCADTMRTARFWSDVLGRPLDDESTEEFASIGVFGEGTGETAWMFLPVPEGKTLKNRCHPDLITPDLEAEIARLVGLGASRHSEHSENDVRWVTLTDPEGNEFDVIAGPSAAA